MKDQNLEERFFELTAHGLAFRGWKRDYKETFQRINPEDRNRFYTNPFCWEIKVFKKLRSFEVKQEPEKDLYTVPLEQNECFSQEEELQVEKEIRPVMDVIKVKQEIKQAKREFKSEVKTENLDFFSEKLEGGNPTLVEKEIIFKQFEDELNNLSKQGSLEEIDTHFYIECSCEDFYDFKICLHKLIVAFNAH